jgi:hypothetical protein
MNGLTMPVPTDAVPRPTTSARLVALPRIMQLAVVCLALAALPPATVLAARAITSGAFLALGVLGAAVAAVIVLLLAVHRLARLLARGEALTAAAAATLTRISLATAFLGVLRAAFGGWLSAELGIASARLASPPAIPDLFLLLLCGVVLCAAQGMAAAARLAEDTEHII